MKVDTLTKTLLAAIAIALWVNAVTPWVQPGSALADVDSDMRQIRQEVQYIGGHLRRIAEGTCSNSTIC